jgi:plasmid segregation protein ParM
MSIFGNSPVKKCEIPKEENADKTEKIQWQTSSKNIGVDLGYGFVKVLNGDKGLKFSSVVGIGKELEFNSFIDLPKNFLDELVVEYNGDCYFVGDLAVRQSNLATRSLDQHRISDFNAKILLLTALGILNKWDGEDFNIVTGLPVSYFAQCKEEWEKNFLGSHSITFIGDKVDKRKNFNIKEIKLIPQPFGSLYNKLLNNFGKIEDEELIDTVIGIIDIGYKTTDFVVADKMELIEHLSFSNNNGLFNAYRIISNQLRTEYGIEKEPHKLDKILEKGSLRVAGKKYDISSLKKEVYMKIADKIITEIHSYWNYKDFDVILLTGGGGQAMADYILPRFSNMELIDEPQFANVRGYQKLAKKVFDK